MLRDLRIKHWPPKNYEAFDGGSYSYCTGATEITEVLWTSTDSYNWLTLVPIITNNYLILFIYICHISTLFVTKIGLRGANLFCCPSEFFGRLHQKTDAFPLLLEALRVTGSGRESRRHPGHEL